MNRVLKYLILLIILTTLTACQLLGRPKPASKMKVTDSKEIRIENATLMDRSPNGEWLIVYTYPEPPDSQFCIYDSAQLEPVFCMPERDADGITLQPVAWSPDSRQLALVEYLPNIPIDTDIWVLNIENATLENITDDGVSGILRPEMGGVPWLDNAPTWSPDNIWIGFSRTTFDDTSLKYETALHKIPALGGEAERITKVSEEPSAIGNGMLAWSADNRLLYTLREEKLDGSPFGLQVVPVDGSAEPKALEELASTVTNSSLLAISPDGTHALVLHEILTQLNTTYALVHVINLRTGESTPLKVPSPHDVPIWFSRSNWVAFSPDSSKIAYVYEAETPTAQWRLALVDVGSDEEVVLQTYSAREYYVNYPFRWGQDDTLMLRLLEKQPPFPIQLLTVK